MKKVTIEVPDIVYDYAKTTTRMYKEAGIETDMGMHIAGLAVAFMMESDETLIFDEEIKEFMRNYNKKVKYMRASDALDNARRLR